MFIFPFKVPSIATLVVTYLLAMTLPSDGHNPLKTSSLVVESFHIGISVDICNNDTTRILDSRALGTRVGFALSI